MGDLLWAVRGFRSDILKAKVISEDGQRVLQPGASIYVPRGPSRTATWTGESWGDLPMIDLAWSQMEYHVSVLPVSSVAVMGNAVLLRGPKAWAWLSAPRWKDGRWGINEWRDPDRGSLDDLSERERRLRIMVPPADGGDPFSAGTRAARSLDGSQS